MGKVNLRPPTAAHRKSVLRSYPKLRVQTKPAIGGTNWPGTSGLLISSLQKKCKEQGLSNICLTVDRLPLSLNHQHKEWVRKVYDPKTKKSYNRVSKRTKPEVEEYRYLVLNELRFSGQKWEPKGITAVVVILESPIWLTKKYTPRQADADNKLKPAVDAAQYATHVPDELHWEFHVYKAVSRRERTIIYLFDLGDIVEYYLP